ncbi:FecR domain-containing protein [Uliginosibacterium sp. 31-12]|uniref:FecR family protein n=1 Tax=Uliginosibacterium sp. 31-12 TaxID=3062781 RepID=UPI0026E34C24|nr:FecR domain-containing protein [Uliginosibacterium sp. 31-12]MDO6386375.1 FecR domain-containing protein [Uliginosibacterium sp. 31-12]
MNSRPHDHAPAASPDPEEDARDFDAFAQDQDPLDIEAATWALRRRNGLDTAGEAELADWLKADPRHGAALEDMEHTFDELRHLPDEHLASLRAGLGERAAGVPPQAPAPAWPPALPRPPARSGWRAWLQGGWLPQAMAAALACVVVAGAWLGWQQWQLQPGFVQAYATERGQQLSVTLPDAASQGSTLQLDTASRAEVRLFRDRREVHLQEGQVMFVVHPDAQRPFHVWAGGVRVTVVGTRFSVRHSQSGRDAGQTVVEVEEGRVRVAPATVDARLASVELHAGQRVVADGRGQLSAPAALPPTAVAPWREGRVSFDQTPLADAIAEFERYGHTGLVVRDPAVAALPVGGSYTLRQFQQFARALPQLLPVRLESRGALTEVVAR